MSDKAEAQTGWVRSGPVRLHVRAWSGAGPGILLLHGLASTSHIWDLVAPRLSRAGVRAIAYDQRGHGRSTKPSSGYGFEHMVHDAAEVIRSTRLRRPVVVGHSWGANVALELAVRRPRSIRGVVLVDGGFLPMRERFDWRTAKDVLSPDWAGIEGMPLARFLDRIRTEMRGTLDVTPEIESVIVSLVHVGLDGRIRPRLRLANHLKILRALWEQDTSGLLRRVQVPTLVLGARSAPGSPDSAGFMEEKRRAARRVRSIGDPVRFEWIEGIHDLPLQRPEALTRRILRFRAQTASAAVRPRRS